MAGVQIGELSSLCKGGAEFGVTTSDLGGFIYDDEWRNMRPRRGEIVPDCNLHVPCVILSCQIAIICNQNEHIDCSLRRKHPILDTDETGNQLRRPDFQNQGRKGVSICLLWEKGCEHIIKGILWSKRGTPSSVCLFISPRAWNPDI